MVKATEPAYLAEDLDIFDFQLTQQEIARHFQSAEQKRMARRCACARVFLCPSVLRSPLTLRVACARARHRYYYLAARLAEENNDVRDAMRFYIRSIELYESDSDHHCCDAACRVVELYYRSKMDIPHMFSVQGLLDRARRCVHVPAVLFRARRVVY